METSLPPLPAGLALDEPMISSGPSNPPVDFEITLPAKNDKIMDILDEDVILPDGRLIQEGAPCISKVEFAIQAKWDANGFWKFRVAIMQGPLAWVIQYNQPAPGSPFIWSIIPDAASSDL